MRPFMKAVQRFDCKGGGGAGPGRKEPEPSQEELAAFAITPDFRDFVRSLTYSTFRDFPESDVIHVTLADPGKYLTPWQERHCLLVVKVCSTTLQHSTTPQVGCLHAWRHSVPISR
jgi:hypothetical protein